MAQPNNNINLIGRLGQAPELKKTNAGKSVCRISLGTNEYDSKNKTGKTVWHSVVLWDKQADYAAEHCGKGDLVAANGSLSYSKFTDKSGVERVKAEINAAGFTRLQSNTKQQGTDDQRDDREPAAAATAAWDDEVPF
jgi:single-strand DNA-binding protein